MTWFFLMEHDAVGGGVANLGIQEGLNWLG
jgi:hypothetical protein